MGNHRRRIQFLNLFKSEYFLEKSIIVIDCLSLWINNLLYKSKIEKRKNRRSYD
ncbi:hypothetical protein LEP1GSC151_5725 [Leptospira interrogans serovar Grippotyphosa str. LT2186]|uniref:Uncharacterized protein n=1 Tax=Leptospira interrogans serovar Grippotyphosa str. LT2186 TaxID=1001599 RepID=M3GRD8_LEPIR|nr:hypothetical protein LEP1GSC151_5725 [Leptospira interrogans serovar Grippotyphosa str. LT2186]